MIGRGKDFAGRAMVVKGGLGGDMAIGTAADDGERAAGGAEAH